MLQDFEFGQLLGEGGFGKVFLTRERRSKCCVVALKAMVEMPQKQ
jgi:serine/threonine protein kinase